jgi:hypothetical protein
LFRPLTVTTGAILRLVTTDHDRRIDLAPLLQAVIIRSRPLAFWQKTPFPFAISFSSPIEVSLLHVTENTNAIRLMESLPPALH